MIDSIDPNNFLKPIIQPNIKFLAVITVITILISRHLETNIIFMISILLFVFVNYKNINETFKDIKDNEKKKYDKVIEDNHRVKHEIHFNEDLNKYLHKMRKFRKYNPQA